jgi:hypothetical protein
MSVGDVRRHLEKMRFQNDCESMLKLIVMYRYDGETPKIIVDCMLNQEFPKIAVFILVTGCNGR